MPEQSETRELPFLLHQFGITKGATAATAVAGAAAGGALAGPLGMAAGSFQYALHGCLSLIALDPGLFHR